MSADDSSPRSVADERAEVFTRRLTKNHRRLKSVRRRTDAYRLYDEDIPELPFIVEVYADVLVFTHVVHTLAPQDAAAQKWHRRLAEAAAQVVDISPDAVVMKSRARRVKGETHTRRAHDDQMTTVSEHGLRYRVNVADFVDTGLFLDHRAWRARLADNAPASVLNLFAYTCSLSVAAAAGGARHVVSVDLSERYLAWGKANMAENRRGAGGVIDDDVQCDFVEADAMHFLRGATERFDLVLVDPPTMSHSPRAADFDIQRDHVALLSAAQSWVAPGGALWFSTNARRFVWAGESGALGDAGAWSETTRQSTPPDFRGAPHRSFHWNASEA